jgi:hypothetical protein
VALPAGARTVGFAVVDGDGNGNDFPPFDGPQLSPQIQLYNGYPGNGYPGNGYPYSGSGLLIRDLALLPPLPPAAALTPEIALPVLWDVTNRTAEWDWASYYVDPLAGEGAETAGPVGGGEPLANVLNMLNDWFAENTPTQSAVYFYSWR